jgi:GT2 family glycosyltransferase
MDSVNLDVVIVSYQRADLLRDCLDSLRSYPPAGRGMIVRVIENAERNGTADLVEREYRDVTLTVAERNLGFSAASNLAIRESAGEYVLVLNPDTQVTEGAIDRLIAVLDANPEVGICGPRLERPNGSFDHAARRSFPTPASALGHFTGVGRHMESGPLAAYRAPEVDSGPVDAINGACMLVRRAALDQVGGFDEGYWMYMEDLDLCYRFAEAGWATWYEPSALVIHLKGGTVGPIRSPRLDYAFHRGMARFYRKHYAPERPAIVNGVIYAGIGAKLAVSQARSAVRRLANRNGKG